MTERKQELRTEPQQQLTDKAKMVEAAKTFAWQIENNPPEVQFKMMKERFPELTKQEIENLLKKP